MPDGAGLRSTATPTPGMSPGTSGRFGITNMPTAWVTAVISAKPPDDSDGRVNRLIATSLGYLLTCANAAIPLVNPVRLPEIVDT